MITDNALELTDMLFIQTLIPSIASLGLSTHCLIGFCHCIDLGS